MKLNEVDKAQTQKLIESCKDLAVRIDIAKATANTKERAMALTKVQEAEHWLKSELADNQ